MDVRRLDRLLRAAGLRLAVIDASGEEVSPFPADAVRDRAGRRFPAHLDVQPPDRLPPEALGSPRYDREPPAAWHARRKRRDQERRGDPAAANDHPTPGQLQFRLLERRYGRTPSWPHRRVQVAESLGLSVEDALGD